MADRHRPDRAGALLSPPRRSAGATATRRTSTRRTRSSSASAQALALIPGASRSGTTITAGLFRGLDRRAAARFSFLLSIPAVVLSAVYEAASIDGRRQHPGRRPHRRRASIIAFVVGLASIAWLMRWLSKHSTFVFIGYRIALGVLLIGLLATGVITAT